MANRVMLRFVMREVPRRGERLGAEILADLIRVKNAAARRAQESESGGSPPDRTRYVHEVHEALAAELDRAETGQADVPQESTREPGSDDDFGEWP